MNQVLCLLEYQLGRVRNSKIEKRFSILENVNNEILIYISIAD